MDYDVIIIGAGLGGLVCGALLAQKGLRVVIFEKRSKVGGCCTSFTRKGFTFDLSVQSIGGWRQGERVRRLLDGMGLGEAIEFIPLDPAREYYFPDRKVYQYTDLSSHIEYLSSFFPQESEGINEVYQIYHSISEEIDRFPHTLSWFEPTRFAREFPFTFQYREKTLLELLNGVIKDPRLKVILGVRSSYALLPPSRLSVIAMASLEMSYLKGGVAVLKGRMEALPQLVAEGFKRCGGMVQTRQEVTGIMVEGNEAVGVRLKNKETITSKVIVSNADATSTFLEMIGDEYLPSSWTKRLKGMKPSFSYFIIYLGVNGELDLSCSNNEIFPGYDLEEEYRYLEEGKIAPSTPYYCLAPSLLNPSHAPQGYSTLCLSYKAPYRLSGAWNRDVRRAIAERIIAQAEAIVPNLRQRIFTETSSTPLTIERMTGNRWGAAYGWAQIPRQAGIYRLSRVSPIDRLYMTGHWTAPGGGVAAVTASGQITADMIWERIKGKE